MDFFEPSAEQLAELRADPLLFEQELDVRPQVAESLERAMGFRAGRRHWRAASGEVYALELADLGRGRPSMAIIYGLWDRYEPRPEEAVIGADLEAFCLWLAQICDDLDVEDLRATLSGVAVIHARRGQ
jgi:hypothetical protein